MSRKAVIYARFSCSKQREASIEDQLRVCREWCERERYEVVAEYCDYAMSGRSDQRPEFQRMISNAGESDIVLVYMMDRFSRSEYDAPAYKHELRKRGVELVSAMEALPDGPERILIEKIYEGLAAVESIKTSVRVKRGMEGNAMKCRTNGVRVYGYRTGADGCYEIDPDEARVVREAFTRRLHGETVNAIARDLAQRGVTTRHGKPCGHTMVYGMLRNEKYTGKYSWGGFECEGGMPAIIDEVTFWRVQGMRAKKQRATEDWGTYALSGKCVCGGCGRNLAGMSGTGRHGVKYEYYGCKRCGMKSVRRDWLESSIAKGIRDLVSDRDEALRIGRMVADCGDDEFEAERKAAQASLRQAEAALQNIMSAIEQGIVLPGTQERVEQLKSQRERAQRDLAMYDDAKVDPELFADFLQCGSLLDDATMLDVFVYQVLVGEDDVLVTLNYDTESKEPVRLTLERVLPSCNWWTMPTNRRTAFAVLNGTVVLRLKRAA